MSAYFDHLTKAVADAGLHRPVLVVDEARLNRNLITISEGVAAPERLRLADKSIPVPALLGRGFEAFGTQKIMSFHLPLTAQVLARFPKAQALMGKPMPVAAAAAFVKENPHADRVTWLIDSAERLAEYKALAETHPMRVAFEVNIGLGRGGFETPDALRAAVASAGDLKVCGIMGYEAHTPALPKLLGGGQPAQARAMQELASFAEVLGPDQRDIINTGGSSTLLGLPETGAGNDFTVGSLMVKPSDFDQEINDQIAPAFFIVTPVLKTYNHQLPGHPRLTQVLQKLRIIKDRIAFAYGGKWMAKPIHPAGLSPSPFFSASSNQHGFCLPRGVTAPDHMVFRPTQSEAVLQHFPDVVVYDGKAITDTWAPFAIC